MTETPVAELITRESVLLKDAIQELEHEGPWVSYGLRAIESDEYRYVGQTTKGISMRAYQHSWEAGNGRSQQPVHRWIAECDEDVICEVPGETAAGDREGLDALEAEWIARLREEGHPLVNIADGGLGTPGFYQPEAWRTEHSARMTGAGNHRFGVIASDETRTRISESLIGRNLSDEHRAKLSEIRKGKPLSAKNRAGISAAQMGEKNHQFGNKKTEAQRAAISAANLGRKMSAETRQRMSEAQRGVPKKGSHTRYHTNLNKISDTCLWCQEAVAA